MLGIGKPATLDILHKAYKHTHTHFTETLGQYRAVSQTRLRAHDYVCLKRVRLARCPRSSSSGLSAGSAAKAVEGASEAANDTCLLRGPALSKWARCAAQSLAFEALKGSSLASLVIVGA